MLKLPQTVVVNWHPNNIKHYTAKGYIYTKTGQPLEINVEDIVPTANVKVTVICDCCGKEYQVTMTNYTRSMKDSGSVVCYDCKFDKTKQTLQDRYGVDAPSKIQGYSEKARVTCLERYGVENAMQLKSTQAKAKQTLYQHYGVTVPLKSEELKHKAKQSCLERYGVVNSFMSEEVRAKARQTLEKHYGVSNPGLSRHLVEKAKRTCIERYGGESSQSDPVVRQKSFETMLTNDGVPSSKEERRFVEILKNIYGDSACESLSAQEGMCFDCFLTINNIKIDVEYDGWYWHKDKQERDKRRDYYCMRHGYKVLRVLSKGSMPTEQQIIEGVNYLVNSEHHFFKIILDDIDI